MAQIQIQNNSPECNATKDLGLPKYIHAFIDNRGKRRFRFYKRGHKGKYIKAPYGTQEFYAECEAVIARSVPKLVASKRMVKSWDARRRNKFIGNPPPSSDIRTVDSLYIMRDESEYKVGRSVRPWRRLYRVRRTGRPNAELIRVFPVSGTDSYKAESGAHKLLAPFAIGGEWFSCDYETARNAIRLSMESAGEPFLNITTKVLLDNGFRRP